MTTTATTDQWAFLKTAEERMDARVHHLLSFGKMGGRALYERYTASFESVANRVITTPWPRQWVDLTGREQLAWDRLGEDMSLMFRAVTRSAVLQEKA